jgi:parallel beta helix pectate lyase-like protein
MTHIRENIIHGMIPDRFSRTIIGFALLIGWGASGLYAATLCVNPGGTSGCKSTISAAVAAANPGDTIQVSPGTFKEDVGITKSLALVAAGWSPVVIDATGLANGIFINGMSAAPKAGVADVVISGFTIRNANFEGILVANGTDITLVGNKVTDNNKALDVAGGTCNGIPAFETNEGLDCGEGIHLIATDHSSVVRNESSYNSGGILITDETGPNHDNLISENNVHDNPFDCGITLASHGPATTVIPTARLPYGVTNNTISKNVVTRNGYQVPGAGAGVGIFAPFPGTTDAGNVVINNDLRNNGLPGVTMHNHAAAPSPAPPVNMNDNVIVGNRISGNGQDTLDAATAGPTGINLFSVAPVWGTVISQNDIDNEAIDVAFNAPAGQVNAHLNDFESPGIGVDNLGTGLVNATENWWGCAAGPGTSKCASAAGPGVSVSPWLTSPFNDDHGQKQY